MAAGSIGQGAIRCAFAGVCGRSEGVRRCRRGPRSTCPGGHRRRLRAHSPDLKITGVPCRRNSREPTVSRLEFTAQWRRAARGHATRCALHPQRRTRWWRGFCDGGRRVSSNPVRPRSIGFGARRVCSALESVDDASEARSADPDWPCVALRRRNRVASPPTERPPQPPAAGSLPSRDRRLRRSRRAPAVLGRGGRSRSGEGGPGGDPGTGGAPRRRGSGEPSGHRPCPTAPHGRY